jgi:Na+-driven multidrug efflux pump
MVVNFTSLIVIRLPLAVFLAWPVVELPGGFGEIPGCGLGVFGAWLAMAADLTARGVAMLFIYAGGRWSNVVV